jgi:putative aldouronate transport system substrate-binding protein
MKKRFLALLLAVCMLLPLVACGETAQGGGEEKTEATGDVVQDTLAAVNAAVKLKEGEEYNFESHLPLAKEGEDNHLMIGLVTSALTTDYDDNDYTKWLEEVTGIDLEFRQFTGTSAETATQISLMIASGETLPDILLRITGISKTDGDNYGRDGYFIDLSEYFKNPELNYYRKFALEERFNWFDDTANSNLMLREIDPETGAMYAYPRMENSPEDRPRSHVSINKAWLEAVGKKVPATIAELRDVLTAFRDQDPNGNGKQDEIPMIGKADSAYTDVLRLFVNAYIYWNYRYHFNVGEDGKLYTPYTEDEYRQALITASDFVKEGLISTLSWTQSAAELKSLFNPEEGEPELCGVITGHLTLNVIPGSATLYDYQPLPPLKAETPKGGYGARGGYNYENELRITSDCKHPVEAFKMLDFLCSDEGFLRCRYGVPGVNWEFIEDEQTTDPRGAKMIRIIGDNAFSTQNNINWHSLWTINDYTYHQTETTDEWAILRGQKYNHNYRNYLEAGQPEKRFTHVVYLREETERLTEIYKELIDYTKDRRAQFCTGVLDPRNDAQWQEYLDGLQALHYDEWLSLAQTAYDRLDNK